MILKLLKNKGYLLIEVLVTVVVLGTTIIFIVRALNSSLFALRRAAYYTKALFLMEEIYRDIKLESSRGEAIPVDSFPRSSSLASDNLKFVWQEELQPTEFATLSEVIFTVSWQDSKSSGQISASTFIPTTTLKGE